MIICLLFMTERVVVTGEDQIVFGRVGEEVVLNCMVDSHIPPQHFDEVSWKKVDKKSDIVLVLLFQNGTIFPESSHEHYRDRAEFFREEIPKGNFSLRLKNVQTADKGEYMCEVHAEYSVSSATVEIGRLGKSSEKYTEPFKSLGRYIIIIIIVQFFFCCVKSFFLTQA